MKAGIITYHYAHNYGAMLQVYSLQLAVSKYISSVEVIDFRPSPKGVVSLQKAKVASKELLSTVPFLRTEHIAEGSLIRYKAFNDFMTGFLKLSEHKYRSYDQLLKIQPYYDFYITGSDQVWNPEIASHNLPAYLLDFVKSENSKKIAYAVSIGDPNIAI